MKKRQPKSEFGKRLAAYRKAKGLTQTELGKLVGVSYRVIAYYEGETQYPPTRHIVPLAKALGITTDELLGLKASDFDFDPRKAALWRKLKIVESLPKTDQKAVLHYIKMISQNRELGQQASKQ